MARLIVALIALPVMVAVEARDDQLVGLDVVDALSQPVIMDQIDLFSARNALQPVLDELPIDSLPIDGVVQPISEAVDSAVRMADGLAPLVDIPWVGRDCEFTDTSDLRFDFGELVARSDSQDFVQEGSFALACKNKGNYGIEVYNADNQPLPNSLLPVKIVSANGETPANILLLMDDGPLSSQPHATEGGLLEHFHRLSAQLVSSEGDHKIPDAMGEIVGDPQYRLVIVKY